MRQLFVVKRTFEQTPFKLGDLLMQMIRFTQGQRQQGVVEFRELTLMIEELVAVLLQGKLVIRG